MIDCVEVPLHAATARGMLRSALTLRLRADNVTAKHSVTVKVAAQAELCLERSTVAHDTLRASRTAGPAPVFLCRLMTV